MKLDAEFLKLPIRFDGERLAAEIAAFGESDWRKHPQGHAGNSALPLIAAHGDPDDDAVKGPMRPTPYLARCPYLRQVLEALSAPWGRTRLMRIEGNGEAHAHVDVNYYWSQHVRAHIPIRTRPEVEFLCGAKSLHMAAGECWLFDTWRMHNVLNHNPEPRIHLVADTVGSAAFWELADRALRPDDAGVVPFVRTVAYDPRRDATLAYESSNFPIAMSPWEIECLFATIMDDVLPGAGAAAFGGELRRFHREWRGLWAIHAEAPSGDAAYRAALDHLLERLKPLAGKLKLANGSDPVDAVRHWVALAALNPELRKAAGWAVPTIPELAECKVGTAHPTPATPPLTPKRGEGTTRSPAAANLQAPVFIVAAPRSGSSLLFETLAQAPGVFTVGGESHDLFEGIPELAPAAHGWVSNALAAEHATTDVVATLRAKFLERLRDRDGNPAPTVQADVRMLEKTPKNALRIPFLRAAFPDARFIYLHRDPRENVSSIMEAWRSGRFVTYPHLAAADGMQWSLLLTPGWREFAARPLADLAAAQWAAANRAILAGLADLPADRWTTVGYAEFLANPQRECVRLLRFAGLGWDRELAGPLPHSKHTLTAPAPDKWRRNAAEVEPALAALPDGAELAARIAAVPRGAAPAKLPPPRVETPRSVNTSTLGAILRELGVSLAVSTYQAGKLFLVRADDAGVNTHFAAFASPMGLARRGNRLALGTANQVWEFRNLPEAGAKREPAGKHDALYLPRRTHYTGDIRIHEIDFAGDELWAVNTRFSCLCTFDENHSFVPRWRPKFVTALAPEDRCHLNGLAVVDGQPKYVTALGTADAPGGWRADKRDGGVLIDVPSGEFVLRGLSMPHSPRWRNGELWVCESGRGGLGVVDPQRGTHELVCEVPGFTRGLDFVGDYAFVGLSQVRESAVFAGLPLTERREERQCGVWCIDLRTGKVAGFLRFEAGVQEIFAVQALPHRWPDVVHDDAEALASAFVLPDAALKELPRRRAA